MESLISEVTPIVEEVTNQIAIKNLIDFRFQKFVKTLIN